MALENKNGALYGRQEGKRIELKRCKYLKEAAIVLLLTVVAVSSVWRYAENAEVTLLVGVIGALVAYVMLKELRESLQTFAEGVLLVANDEGSSAVNFDYGRGIAAENLDAQNMVERYNRRECRNVLHGAGYLLEEDWFYMESSTRFVPIRQTAFEGIILEILLSVDVGKSGQVLFKDNKTVVLGDLAKMIKESGVLGEINQLKTLLEVKKVELRVLGGKLYIWAETKRKMYYQFSLLKANSTVQFVSRINVLDKIAKSIAEKINCGNK